jgi:hypothetical protein
VSGRSSVAGHPQRHAPIAIARRLSGTPTVIACAWREWLEMAMLSD